MSASPQFGVWATPETRLEIEYSLAVLEEIRRAVVQGLQNLSRGLEVGGILFGVADGGRVRIEAVREIFSEHAFGPTFQLSETDKSGLLHQLDKAAADPALRELIPLGWFVSHPRRDLALQPTDVEIFNQFFPGSNQVALVVRPGRAGHMRGGFFVREPDGTLKSERSHLDFSFPESTSSPHLSPHLSGSVPRVHREVGREIGRVMGREAVGEFVPEHLPLAAEAPAATPFSEAPRTFGEPPVKGQPKPSTPGYLFGVSTRSILLLAAGAVALFGASFAVPKFFGPKVPAEPLSLSVLDQSGQLRVQWNHNSKTVTNATSGSLEVIDGKARRTFPLTPQELTSGSYTYARQTGDVQVRLGVTASTGNSQEASRFLGSAPPERPAASASASASAAVSAISSGESAAELKTLRSENARLRSRNQQLQRTLVILQGRLGITREDR